MKHINGDPIREFPIDMESVEARVAAHILSRRGKSIFQNRDPNPSLDNFSTQVAADLFGVRPGRVTMDMRSAARGLIIMRMYGAGENRLNDQLINKYGPSLGRINILRFRWLRLWRTAKNFGARWLL